VDLNLVSKSREVFNRARHEAAERILSQSLKVLAHSPDRNYQRISQALGKLAKSKQQHMAADWMSEYLSRLRQPMRDMDV